MFQPETEDMLPRCAPKPSVPLDMNTAAIVRPTVPEVSILFGAPQQAATATPVTSNALQQPQQQQQTYAAWKKQILPKVTFPPAGSEVYSINGHVVSAGSEPAVMGGTETKTNLYPLRPVTANVAPMSYTAANTNANHFVSAQTTTTQMQQYRRSLEQPQYYVQQQNMQENLQRRSIGSCTGITYAYAQAAAPSPAPASDVLSICAGTQTDAALLMDSPTKVGAMHLANLATKDDFQHVVSLLGELRMGQMRMMETLETLKAQQQTVQQPVLQQDASTQYTHADYRMFYEQPQNQLQHIEYDNMEDYNRLPPTAHDRYQPIKDMHAYHLDTTRQPAAQSTGYQAPHTPRTNSAAPIKTNKPNTEKSMLMNDLAMKYLPSEQLNELLQELNIAPAATQSPSTPLKPIENVERRPTDVKCIL